MDRYETVKPLGNGDATLLLQRKADHEQFVCKKITYSSIDDANRGLQGALSLARFSSEFVTHFEDIFFHIREDNNSTVFDLNLVIEYCSAGSLWNKLLSKRDRETDELDFVPLVLAEKWIVELCKGLKSVHQLKVVHKDLKSENMFLNSHDDIKIGEFRLVNLTETEKKESNSRFYFAPEFIKTGEYNMKTDIWSLGCILFEISTSRLLPVDKINFNELLAQGGKDTLLETIRKYFSQDRAHLLALVEFILEPEADKRPDIDQILAHEFFNNYKLQSSKAKELQANSLAKIDVNFQDGIVRQLNKSDFDVTLDMMSQELFNEPRMRFLFSKDDNKRKKFTRILLNAMLQLNAQRGNNTWGRFAPDGQLQAAAAWFPPDRNLRPSVALMAKVGFENLGDFLKIGPKTGLKIKALLEYIQKSIEAEFPDNCWILFYVAVNNQFQGKGIGRHLLSHVLTVADYHGQDCGTICFDGHGVEFFNKLGFQLHKMIPVPIKNMPNCPPCQMLIRKARKDIDHSLTPQSSSDNLTSSKKKRHSKINVL